MRRLTWLLALCACSDSDLYVQSGADPLGPDRVNLEGQLCTEDTGGSKFPVKVLLMVDSSAEMFAADPGGQRFARPGGGIEALVDRYRGQAHVRFGFVSLGATARPVPLGRPQRFWAPQDPETILALNALQAPNGSQRDMVNAISQAESFITTDIDDASPGEVLRTRYLVYMLLAGPPDPDVPQAELAEQVERVRSLILSRGALDFRLSIGLLYFGERSIDLAADAYECYPPGAGGDPLCACSGTVRGGPSYCSVFCAVQAGLASDAEAEDARQMYEDLVFLGGGELQDFHCPESISVDVPIASDAVRLVKKDIIAFNTNVRLTPDGPVVDSDGDGLSDREERKVGTSPTARDTDGDGLTDRLELRTAPEQDALDGTDRPPSCLDPAVSIDVPDRDLDLLGDCEEGLLSTSPSIPDTDGDGLPDLLEFSSGTVPTSAEDRLLDYDVDGYDNAREVREHTDPRGNDGAARGVYGYRHAVTLVGLVPVATLENPVALPGITFRDAAQTLVGGQGYLRWRPCDGTLEWSDARYLGQPPFVPVPESIPDDGVYRLEAQSPNGETIWAEVEVHLELLPACADTDEVVTFPLISVSPRNCYDVRISNIKLMPTLASDGEPAGLNRVLVFFTQAPEDRLSSPGIAKLAELRVRIACNDPDDASTCARSPSGNITLTDSLFVSVSP